MTQLNITANPQGITGAEMIDAIQATTLVAYSSEIMPRVRELAAKKQELKDFKEGLDVADLQQAIDDAKNNLAEFYAKEDTVNTLKQEIDELQKELGLALKAASKGVGKVYKPGELKTFFNARAKEKVKPTVAKGEMFSKLDNTLQAAAV